MTIPITTSKNPPLKKHLIILLFAFFILALIWVIVFKCNVMRALHIERNQAMSIWERITLKAVPFELAFKAIANGSILELLAVIFNVVCFVPFGAVLCFLTKKKTAILSAAAFSFAVEVFQLFSCWGGFELMDIVLNTLGAAIGVLLYTIIFCKFSNRITNILAVIFLVIITLLDTYAIINTINNFPHLP